MRIRLNGNVTGSGEFFTYGNYTSINRNFLIENDRKEFSAVRHSINYFRLANGYLVHIYECDVLSFDESLRAELEFSIEWAKDNPELFKVKYNKFFEDYPKEEFTHSSSARQGFLTLIAERN